MAISNHSSTMISYGCVILCIFLVILMLERMNTKNKINEHTDLFDFKKQDNAENDVIEQSRSRITCDTCHVYDLYAENTHDYECIEMKFEPPAPICLHAPGEDAVISVLLRKKGSWETKTALMLQKWLLADKDMGFIDIGTNIGVFSLQVAAMGRQVVSVEPTLEMIKHFHKAIKIGGFEDRVILLQNAVGAHSGIAEIIFDKEAPGKTHMREVSFVPEGAKDESYTRFIVMDDLLPFCNFKSAVLKIDVEGFEHQAFVEGRKLFDNINIPYVIMEWIWLKRYGVTDSESEDSKLVNDMVRFFEERDYIPKSKEGDTLKTKSWTTWPTDIVWVKRGYSM